MFGDKKKPHHLKSLTFCQLFFLLPLGVILRLSSDSAVTHLTGCSWELKCRQSLVPFRTDGDMSQEKLNAVTLMWPELPDWIVQAPPLQKHLQHLSVSYTLVPVQQMVSVRLHAWLHDHRERLWFLVTTNIMEPKSFICARLFQNPWKNNVHLFTDKQDVCLLKCSTCFWRINWFSAVNKARGAGLRWGGSHGNNKKSDRVLNPSGKNRFYPLWR